MSDDDFIPFDMVVPKEFNPAHAQAYAERVAKEIAWLQEHGAASLLDLPQQIREHLGKEPEPDFTRFLGQDLQGEPGPRPVRLAGVSIPRAAVERREPDALDVIRQAREVAERGASHGDDAARYDHAYGTNESVRHQASRRADDYYGTVEMRLFYIDAFVRAYQRTMTDLEED